MMSKKKFTIKAIIYDKRGRVLSIGENSYQKTHPMQARHVESVGLPFKIFLHAEVHAILKCRDLKRAHKIAVFRFDSDGDPVNAHPCPVCMSAIREAGIGYIEFT